LLIWVHGFKGTEVTFESFPERVVHLLKAGHPSLRVESHVFPSYQTRGELHAATLAFVDWLTELVVRLENDHGAGGGAGKAKIVLMGHSMGGLLIADAARDIVDNTRELDPVWPKVVGIMAFDTPYLGLHPHTFKHQLTQAASYYEQARSVASTLGMMSPAVLGIGAGLFGKKETAPSSEAGPSRSKAQPPDANGKGKAVFQDNQPTGAAPTKSYWSMPAIPAPSSTALYGLGAVALGAAAVGTAYYQRDTFMNGWKWGYDHMTFVRNLWDAEALRERLDALDRLSHDRNIRFWNFYTHLPPKKPQYLVTRTFTILPPISHPTYPRWQPQTNTVAPDEVQAHMNMFNPRTNDGFYDLGLVVVMEIGERIEEEGVGRVVGKDGGSVDVDKLEGLNGQWKEEKDEKGRSVWVEV